MPLLYAGVHLDSSLLASSLGCMHNGATAAVILSEFNTDSELRATKHPSEV